MIATPKLDEAITRENFAFRMRRLMETEDFKGLKMRWLDIRIKILEDGKKNRAEHQWAILDGFDSAVLEPERWLKYANSADKNEGDSDD